MKPDRKRFTLQGRLEDGPYTPRSNELEESVLAKKRGVATEAGQEMLGERVAQLRKERGLTQVELAEALGVAQSIVSKYESGELRLHGELIIQLAELLDVTADELLGLVDRPRAGPTKDKRLARRLQDFDKLPKRDRDALTRTVDAFLAARGRAAAA